MNREHMGTGPPPATLSLPNPPSPRSSPSSMTQLSQVESQPPQAPQIGWACTLRRGPAGATRAGSILREASSAREKGNRQVNVLGQVLRSHTDPILWPKRDLGLLALPAGRVGPLAGQEPAQSKKDPWVRPHGLMHPSKGTLSAGGTQSKEAVWTRQMTQDQTGQGAMTCWAIAWAAVAWFPAAEGQEGWGEGD